MKKIILLIVLAFFIITNISYAECNFSKLTRHKICEMREGRKIYDLYWSQDLCMKLPKGIVAVALILDYTPWGVEVRKRTNPSFPIDTRIVIQTIYVDVIYKELSISGSIYLDSNCNFIKEIVGPNEILWEEFAPNTIEEIWVEIGIKCSRTTT